MRELFTRARKGHVYGGFATLEADLIRTLVSQVIELVRDGSPAPSGGDPLAALLELDGPVDAPEDPVLARLLPDAYREDVEAAGEFRRFTERGLRDQKASNGLVVLETLRAAGLPDEVAGPSDADADAGPDPGSDIGPGDTVEVDLSRDAVQAWLRSLTDVRLALATRLGVEDDDEDEWAALDEDDPRSYLHDVYDWLGYVQESLVRAAS